MRYPPPAIMTNLEDRSGLFVHSLIWITSKDRDTGAPQSLGIWTGDDHQTVTIDGESRTYYGVGSLLEIDAFVSQAQGNDQTWSFKVSSLHEQVIEAIRIYDSRLGGVEAHSWFFQPATYNPLAPPVREFRGTILEVNLPTPEVGGSAIATVTCVSDAYRLTRGLTLKRSDAALRKVNSLDDFRKYNTISGAVTTAWGEKTKEPAKSESATSVGMIDKDREYGGNY